jgi:N-acetyl-gamma-glutamyl-phosphate reductase
VGVLGASGYAGGELCRLLGAHPRLELIFATANERRGESVRAGGSALTLLATDDAPFRNAELVFSALPHGVSGTWVDRVRGEGARVVDLSSDLRPGHTAREVPYGLPEWRRDLLPGADVIANPGCYPTAILLSLLPLLSSHLVRPGACVTINAASGVSGAGNMPKPELLFGEVTENYRAYAVGNDHRHLPEMNEVVGTYGADVDLLFTPHLLPVARGILATSIVPLRTMPDDLLGVWRRHFAGEPFVEVTESLPSLRDVAYRNVVRVTARPAKNLREPAAIVIAAIDNLVKGAAGQAIQNANAALGIAEPTGLPA